MESVLKKLLSVCLVCLLVGSLGEAMPSRDRTCMCYYHFYNCDTFCAARYKSEHNLSLCWGSCVLSYTKCLQRCTGEDLYLNMPDEDHQYIDEARVK